MNRIIISIVLLVPCLAPPATGMAPRPNWILSEFRFPDTNPFEEVMDITESSDGALWMASWGGGVGLINGTLHRFYSIEDGLPSDFTTSIAIDPEGRVWVGTARGLALIQHDKVVPLPQPLPNPESGYVRALLWRPNGELWAGMENGSIAVYQPDSGSWRILWFCPASFQGRMSVNSFHKAPDGTVWVALGTGGLLRIKGELIEWLHPSTLPIPRIKSLMTHPDGSLWAAGSGVPARYDGNSWETLPIEYDCLTLASGPGNVVLAGTSSGVVSIEKTGPVPIPMVLQYDAPLVKTICFSRDGTGWIGTKEGVLRITRPRWRSTSHTPMAIRTLHHAFHAAPGSAPLAINTEGEVVRYEGEVWSAVASIGISPWPGAKMLYINDHHLWVSIETIVREVDLITGTLTERPNLPSGQTNGLAKGFDNTPIAYGVYGALLWDGQDWKPLQPDGSDDRSEVKSIESMASGALLVCRIDSVEVWTHDTATPLYRSPLPGPDLSFEHAIEAADGTLWVASSSVLHLSANGEILEKLNLPNTRRTRRILEASDGTLWFGSQSNGVTSLRNGRMVIHSHADGIPSDNLSALGEYPEGTLWVATDNNGLFRYQPETDNPETYIMASPETLPANGIAVFSVAGYDAWNNTPPHGIAYSWRLIHTTDPDASLPWTPFTTGTTIVTPPLLPGKYIFEARASDKDHNADPSPIQVEFLVLAPLWARIEFILPLLAGLAIVMVLVIREALSRGRLHESERNYRILFNAASDGMIVHDRDTGRVVDANRQAENILGWSCEEMLADAHITYPYSFEGLTSGSEEHHVNDRLATRRDGSNYWVDISLTHTVIAGKPRWLATLRDTSHRHKAHEENLRLVRAVEQVAELILITDVDGTILYANPAAEKITGYTRAEIVGSNPRLFNSGQQDEAFYSNLWRTLLHTGQWSGRIRNARKDGTNYERETSITSLRDESGRIVNYVAVGRDVTDETRMEARLRQAQKLEAIGTLAGGIAHDFNNLLSPIIGYTELVIDELPADSQARDNLQSVLNAGERARTLVQQILAFSRQTSTERQPVNVHEVVCEALKLLRASIPSTIAFQEDLGLAIGTVYAHPSHIHQIIMNLGTNAYHAMEANGGTLTVILKRFRPDTAFSSRYPHITPDTEYIQITVSDTGHGMNEAALSRIFDPFFTTKELGRGTGLGLATVHGIVTELGGDISVYSEVGKGTTFHVYLPRTASEKAADIFAVRAAPKGNGERILVVDDETPILDFTAQLLTMLNYHPVTISSSPEALALIRENPEFCDAILSDLTMPILTGVQLATSITSINRNLPIILMTGFSDYLTSEHTAQAGITCILQKPFTSVALAQALRDALNPGSPPQTP